MGDIISGRRFGLKWGGPRKQISPSFRLSPSLIANLPPWADVRPNCPVGHGYKVFDQGEKGSCVGAGGRIAGFAALVLSGETDLFDPSVDGLYDSARILDGDFNSDAGTTISTMLDVLVQCGLWPQDRPGDPANEPYQSTFNPKRPSEASLAYGQNHQGLVRAHVAQTACVLKTILAMGVPVLCGFNVYQEDMDVAGNRSDGIMPRNPAGSILGGHNCSIVGYNDTDQPQAAPGFEHAPIPPGLMTDENSWSETTGDHGYIHFAQSRVLSADYFDDFGALQSAEIG